MTIYLPAIVQRFQDMAVVAQGKVGAAELHFAVVVAAAVEAVDRLRFDFPAEIECLECWDSSVVEGFASSADFAAFAVAPFADYSDYLASCLDLSFALVEGVVVD